MSPDYKQFTSQHVRVSPPRIIPAAQRDVVTDAPLQSFINHNHALAQPLFTFRKVFSLILDSIEKHRFLLYEYD